MNRASWGIDRFGDDAERARARVELATAGVFGARAHAFAAAPESRAHEFATGTE